MRIAKIRILSACLDTFETNIAEGTGVDLPAILGSKSMQEKDAVIILRAGKEMMVFPGPGGYKIEWGPGTLHFQLERRPLATSSSLAAPTTASRSRGEGGRQPR